MTTNQYSQAVKETLIRPVEPSKPPFGYYGAKQRLASRIIKSLPPHNAWVEAFCGSAAITLAKTPAQIEIINDLDGNIVNLFKQLRDNSEALCKAVALTPYAREEYLLARESNDDNLAPLEKARRFLVATMMTVNGVAGQTTSGFSFSQSYSREGREARVSRWFNLPQRLTEVVERIRNTRIENRDARDLLPMFANRPATLVYLDPPYFVKRSHRYNIDPNYEQFHKELLTICCKAKCMIIISGYNNELYDKMLSPKKGWTKTRIKTHTRDTTGKDHCRTEILWKNRYFREAFKKKQVLLKLSKKEIKNNKVNPVRKK